VHRLDVQGCRLVGDMDRIVSGLLHPAVQALLLAMVAVAWVLARRPRVALACAILAVGWLGIASTPWLALRLRAGLVVPHVPLPRTVDAIVVLGGGKLPAYDWSLTDTRAGLGLALWRQQRAGVLLVSGSDQAKAMARGFERAGVPSGQLVVEAASHDTHENARNSAALLRGQGITRVVLVTSAIHVRRAEASFVHEGIGVTPAAVDEDHDVLSAAPAWVPRRDALTLTARCLRERLALRFYAWRGWI